MISASRNALLCIRFEYLYPAVDKGFVLEDFAGGCGVAAAGPNKRKPIFPYSAGGDYRYQRRPVVLTETRVADFRH